MALPVFDRKEDIPAAFADGYVERAGKWHPDDSGYQENNRRLLGEKRTLQETLDAMRADLGDLTPAQARQLATDKTKADDDKHRAAGDFDKLLEKRTNETKAEYDKQIASLSAYKTKYEDREVEIAIRDAASKAGVLSEDMPFVLDIVKGKRVRLDDTTGKIVVVDKDGDVSGATVEKFFADTFKTEAPKFYAGAGGSGGDRKSVV